MPALTAAGLLVDKLIAWGVDTVFGLPGDGNNGIMEALRQRRDKVRFVGVRHESAAAFAATGYAKFTGRLGVCLATSGPGATNMMTGLYDAKMDGVPVLAITGMPFHDLLGTYYQQDVDTPALFKDVAVYSERVMGAAHVDSIADVAVRHAIGRRGVAHLGFPNDLQRQEVEADKRSMMDRSNHTSHDLRTPRTLPTEADLKAAADVLNAGARVAIVAGAGTRGALDELLGIAERLGATITTPYGGKDVVPADDPHLTGTMGFWETTATVAAFQACDTVLLVGTSFPYLAYFPEQAGRRSVQIDLHGERLGLRYPADVALQGGAKETLAALLPLLEAKADRAYLTAVQAEMRRWKATQEGIATKPDGPLKGEAVARAVNRHLTVDAIVCGDAGQNTSFLAKGIDANGRRRIDGSGHLASMGSALPYAIGAAVAFPGRQVVAFVGDGGLAQTMGDLATVARYGLSVKVVVLSNGALNQIRWEQLMNEGNPETEIDLSPIDFPKVAEACGLAGFHVKGPGDVDATIAQAFAHAGPALVQADVDPLEPFMAAQLKPEAAERYAEALEKGTAHEREVIAEIREKAAQGTPDSLPNLEAALARHGVR